MSFTYFCYFCINCYVLWTFWPWERISHGPTSLKIVVLLLLGVLKTLVFSFIFSILIHLIHHIHEYTQAPPLHPALPYAFTQILHQIREVDVFSTVQQYFINFMFHEVLVLFIVLHQVNEVFFLSNWRIHWIREVLNFESLLKSLLKSLIEYITVMNLKPVLSLVFFFIFPHTNQKSPSSLTALMSSFFLSTFHSAL